MDEPFQRVVDLDLTQTEQVNAYRLHTAQLLRDLPDPSSPENASTALQALCQDSAAWVQDHSLCKKARSRGRRHYDGWSPPAMALKAQLVALIIINGHLHGYRGHAKWRTQDQMDRDLPTILTRWERAVRRLSWPNPTDIAYWLEFTGYPPAKWRLCTLPEALRPGFCLDLIQKVKRRLHGRFRMDLRRQISAATNAREALREQGKLKKVIASILHKDTDLYALHSLQTEHGILTDAQTLHNLVTAHFLEWYRTPCASPNWPDLLTDRIAFHALADSKSIPPHLTQSLWDAFTFPLQLHNAELRRDLQQALESPPSLAEFQAAIQHHRGSTAPGATGLTYNMVKGWPATVIERVHNLLTLAFSGPTPSWLQWGWLCPEPKDPEQGVTLDGLRPLHAARGAPENLGVDTC